MADPGFACPNCKQAIVTAAGEFYCGSCAATFPVKDGIADFFAIHSHTEDIDLPSQTWLDPEVVAARDEYYRLCARHLKGMQYCIREMTSRGGVGTRLLEVGMGTGHFTRWLAQEALPGTTIYAFDFSWPILEAAKNNTRGYENIRLFRANARGSLPFTDESFNALLVRLAPLGPHGTPNVQAGYQLLKPGGWYFEAGWEPSQHPTSPTEWAIQHGFEHAESHRWQYWRTQTVKEQHATQIELEHMAAQGIQCAVKSLKRGNVTRKALNSMNTQQILTIEHLLIAQKPYHR